ncbi:hypothetical protein [Enterococcus phage vB_EfaS_Ef5.4]|nr:hypothetical protein [Enterococcus phage vB_EfaS_Ef5.4]
MLELWAMQLRLSDLNQRKQLYLKAIGGQLLQDEPDYTKCNGFAREIRKIEYEMQELEYHINTLEEEYYTC